MNRKALPPLLALALAALLLVPFMGGAAVSVPPGTMLHARQALERYDALGESLTQFLETWTDGERAVQREIAPDGRALWYAYRGPDGEAAWEAGALRALEPGSAPFFLADYAALKAAFPLQTEVMGQEYAGRGCFVSLLEDPAARENWLKLYVDDETGFVLFADAPLFRLRTSLLEAVSADGSLLVPPGGIAPEVRVKK